MAYLVSTIMVVLVMSSVFPAILANPPSQSQQSNRDGKFLNLEFLPFVSVAVQPHACKTKTDGNGDGVCASSSDCQKNGGKGDGSCSNGYGVCCVYEKKCGGTVSSNNTYLINKEYPEAVNTIDNCQYTIQKVNNDVCQLRLDFEVLKLHGPDNTSSCSHDTFTFVGTAGSNPTVICGDNSGQHMYLELGGGNGGARVNIATTTTDFDRSWRIKVTQIPCQSSSRAPPNCLQYYTEYSGTIKSFNYQPTPALHQLGDQLYTACVRTREGFCGIKYTADHFSLSKNGTNPDDGPEIGDEKCKEDFLLVATVPKNGEVGDLKDRYCGSRLDELITYSKPFEIRVHTDSTETSDETNNQGFSIRYTQIPC